VNAHPRAASPGKEEVEQEILKVEGERDQAIQTREMIALNRIYGDDIVIVNTRGRVLTKPQRLADFQSGDLHFLSFSQGDYKFHVYGDTVIMTGRADSVVEYHGKVNRIPRRFTFTYVKQGGHWRLVAQNETLIAEP
jgi:ketosteroid isomerase-like protein